LKEAFLTQATQEQTASSGMEEGFTSGHQALVILAQTAALIGPGKGAYHPTPGQELDAGGPKPLGGERHPAAKPNGDGVGVEQFARSTSKLL